jgi:hypothetical protein
VFEQVFASRDSWDKLIKEAQEWLNTYITPYEFAGIVIFEEEHPLMERESQSGKRNIIVYHTAGPNPIPIRDSTEVIGDIYTFTTISDPEGKDWNGTYNKVLECIESSGQVQGHFVATAITSDESF